MILGNGSTGNPKVDAQLDWCEIEALIAFYAVRLKDAAEGRSMHPAYMPPEYSHARLVGLMALREELNKKAMRAAA